MTEPNRLLLVDDDADERDLFRIALDEVAPGLRCVAAADGKQALNFLESHRNEPPEVIFMDINMPVMSGWECLAHIRKDPALRNIPVVVYSTSSSPRDREIAFDLGAACFGVKADDISEMKQILSFIIRNFYKQPEAAVDKTVPKGVYLPPS